jgi:radical SAM protein with 4Fe4S-binding SPASM domain
LRKALVSFMRLPDFALWDKCEERRIPLSFSLEITARCNNDCRHCCINLPADDKKAQIRELSLTEISHLADEAVALGTMWCLITGGEPLLRDDFPEIYLNLKHKGLLVSVFTNATLVHDDHIRLFKKYPPRDIEVTVYGVTRETYERVTKRRGSFKAFMRGLDLLFDAGIRVRLKAMAMRSNAEELPAISHFCRERTRDYFRFDPFLNLRFNGNAECNAGIRSERLLPGQIVGLEQADPERNDALRKNCRELIDPEMIYRNCNHIFQCGAGRSSFSIGYEGLFRLCCDLWHPDCVYDLRKGTLADAWNDFAPAVMDRRSNRKAFLEKCHVCPIANLCCWCPARAYLETGELDAHVEYFCRVAHARAETFGNRKTTAGSKGKQN